MSYYENQGPAQWPSGNQQQQQQQPPPTWDHQTPPTRSGASSALPREEPVAFSHQLEEVDRAIDNLVKSGKMFNMGGRHGRVPPGGGTRPHSMGEFGDSRGHPSSNLQNFYASQRHQSSRGSNEAESMMQAKRRMAAQRERELRNYHQEQQFNRTVLAEISSGYNSKNDRTLTPGSMSEDERRELIARQRSALYATRPGVPGPQNGPPSLRGHSPFTYDPTMSRAPHPEGTPTPGVDAAQQGPAGPNQRSRANSTSSPQSNAPSNKGVFETAVAQHSSRTSNSSPGGSPPRQGAPVGTKPAQSANTVAPIGTRPSVSTSSQSAANPALNKRSTTPLPSPLSHGYTAPGADENAQGSNPPSNPPSAAAEGPVGLGGWGSRGGVWGNKSSGLQASVWG